MANESEGSAGGAARATKPTRQRRPEDVTFENVLAQLRHAYALVRNDEQTWTPQLRQRFAEGLLGPQIEKLEVLSTDYERRMHDLATAFQANARLRRRLGQVEEQLLAKANDIGSASQARRIIFSIFRGSETG